MAVKSPTASGDAIAPHAAATAFRPFSSCRLFSLQTEFYDDRGLESWACGMVPQFITSNAWVAAAYADTIIASWLPYANLAVRRGSTAKFTILELGAGSGKLAHGLLRVLLPRADAVLGRCCSSRIRYIMTDAAPSVVRGWMQQPQLMAFARAGLMDFAVLAAERSEWALDGIRLCYSGELWRPWEEDARYAAPGAPSQREFDGSSVHPPVIAIAGYVLDSLPLDVWRVQPQPPSGSEAGEQQRWQLRQGLVRLHWDGEMAHASDTGAVAAANSSRGSSAAAIKSFRAEWRFVCEHEAATRREEDVGDIADAHLPSSCCTGSAGVEYYRRQQKQVSGAAECAAAPVASGSIAAPGSPEPPARTASERHAHCSALTNACAAAADRVLDWYLAHGCDTDMHEAFACEYAPPAHDSDDDDDDHDDDRDGDDDGDVSEDKSSDGDCSGSGVSKSASHGQAEAAAALLNRLKAAAPGPNSLAASQRRLFTCPKSGRLQPIAEGQAAPGAPSVTQATEGQASPSATGAFTDAAVAGERSGGQGAGLNGGSEAATASPKMPFSTFCLPIGPMRALANLLAFTTWQAPLTAAADARAASDAADASPDGTSLGSLCGPGFLLLCADKGLLHPSSYVGSLLPDVHRHGSFSTMVNFHALGLWTQIIANGVHGAALPAAAASAEPAPVSSLSSASTSSEAAPAASRQGHKHVTAVLISPHDDVNIKTALFALVPRQPLFGAHHGDDAGNKHGASAAGCSVPDEASTAPTSLPLPAFLDLCTHGELAAAADRFYASLVSFGPSDVFDLYHALSRASPSPLLTYAYGAASGKYERVRSPMARPERGHAADTALGVHVAALSSGTDDGAAAFGAGVHATGGGSGATAVDAPPGMRTTGRGRPLAEAVAEAKGEGDGEDTLLCSDSESDTDTDSEPDPDSDSEDGNADDNDHDATVSSDLPATTARKRRHGRAVRQGTSATPAAHVSATPLLPAAAGTGRHASAHRFLSLRAAVALCALLHWDGDAVHQFRGIFALRLRTLTPPRRHSLWSGLLTAWAGAYLPVLPPAGAVDGSDGDDDADDGDDGKTGRQTARAQLGSKAAQLSEYDVPFDIGRIVHLGAGSAGSSDRDSSPAASGLAKKVSATAAASGAASHGCTSHLAAAQAWYMESLRRVSPRCPTTAFNLALCCLGLGQTALARGWLAAALAYSGGQHLQARQCVRELQDADGHCADDADSDADAESRDEEAASDAHDDEDAEEDAEEAGNGEATADQAEADE